MSMVGVKNVDALLNSDSEKEFSEIMEIANNEGANVKVRLEEGEICEKIVETAEDERADLIIMGAKKQNIIEKLFVSDDIDKVTSQAPCPILLVKS